MAVNCAREASRTGVKRFIHMSTAQVYNSDKVTSVICEEVWGRGDSVRIVTSDSES